MWSSDVVVHPWVGKLYETPCHLKHKTLILGESNFTELEQFKPNLVTACVLNDISTDENVERDTTGFCRFSTKIRRIIFGCDESLGPNEFWQDVAFYNFVQSLVGDRARVRPTTEMWRDSVPAFVEIVSQLQPSRVLVLGKANWNNLRHHVQNVQVDQHVADITIGSKTIRAGYVNHPSSSLSYETWRPVAQRLLLM